MGLKTRRDIEEVFALMCRALGGELRAGDSVLECDLPQPKRISVVKTWSSVLVNVEGERFEIPVSPWRLSIDAECGGVTTLFEDNLIVEVSGAEVKKIVLDLERRPMLIMER